MIGLAPTFVKLRDTVGCYHLHLTHDLSTSFDAALRVCSVSYQHNNTLAWAAVRLSLRPLPQQDHRSAYLVVVDTGASLACVLPDPVISAAHAIFPDRYVFIIPFGDDPVK